MANKMPSTPMKMGRSLGVKAAGRGPNPDDKMQGPMNIPGPARFAGTVSGSKGPVHGGTGSKDFYLMSKPLSSDKGNPAKKV